MTADYDHKHTSVQASQHNTVSNNGIVVAGSFLTLRISTGRHSSAHGRLSGSMYVVEAQVYTQSSAAPPSNCR